MELHAQGQCVGASFEALSPTAIEHLRMRGTEYVWRSRDPSGRTPEPLMLRCSIAERSSLEPRRPSQFPHRVANCFDEVDSLPGEAAICLGNSAEMAVGGCAGVDGTVEAEVLADTTRREVHDRADRRLQPIFL